VTDERTTLRELALLFLRLGATAFGGPAAHIAMMKDEVVRRRGWLDEERFLDLIGATNLIPGPNSTEMAIHIGWERRRWAGLAVAGVCFILPAVAITGALRPPVRTSETPAKRVIEPSATGKSMRSMRSSAVTPTGGANRKKPVRNGQRSLCSSMKGPQYQRVRGKTPFSLSQYVMRKPACSFVHEPKADHFTWYSVAFLPT
jgi:hypothetical protein